MGLSINQLIKQARTAPAPDGPAPDAPWEVRRAAELLAEIHTLKAQIDASNRREAAFRRRHLATDARGQLHLRVKQLTDRPALDAEWRALRLENKKLLRRWSEVLSEYAPLAAAVRK